MTLNLRMTTSRQDQMNKESQFLKLKQIQKALIIMNQQMNQVLSSFIKIQNESFHAFSLLDKLILETTLEQNK